MVRRDPTSDEVVVTATAFTAITTVPETGFVMLRTRVTPPDVYRLTSWNCVVVPSPVAMSTSPSSTAPVWFAPVEKSEKSL